MTLPAPNLDDLRFQETLVNEARKRIAQYCPDWTDMNVSDPGITLIELFAWMTEMMVYRLNRVPEKNYIKFLDLLGMKRHPASSARVNLTFWLSVPLPISPDNMQDVVIPQGLEVRSSPAQGESEVVFSVDRAVNITPPVLLYVRKEKEIHRNYLENMGNQPFLPFDPNKPKEGDAFYLGFDPKKNLSGHILRLSFTSQPTEAVGISRKDPPWVWECSLGDGLWQEVPLSTVSDEKDTTGGLNNTSGSLVLYLPLEFRPDAFHGRDAYWVRCRLKITRPSQKMYEESPRVMSITPTTLGASVAASHAQVVKMEPLGRSTGDPGQTFTLQHAPILELSEGETLLVEEFHNGENVLVPWEYVSDFSNSKSFHRHYALDAASGTIQLGPSVRQQNGQVVQYGRVPEHGRHLYFKQYRYGGGVQGNVPRNSLQTMNSSVAFVARVSNRENASGGKDQETMEELKLRTQRELQAQKRAVTAQDYEQLVLNYSRYAARVRCITPGVNSHEAGIVKLLIIPSASEALQGSNLASLRLNGQYVTDLQKHLDQYRLLTTHVRITEPRYIGVQVSAKVVSDEYSIPDVVASRVDQHLRNLLNPVVPYIALDKKDQLLERGWDGWVFGRNLFLAEVFAMIQRIPGVKYVLDVSIATREINLSDEVTAQRVQAIPEEPKPLAQMKGKMLDVPDDTLLCSLDHQVSAISLEQFESEGKA